ncbi:MAG TPA: hypothetical protein VJN70_14385 [Gemmatimonadaceae bacterium]|nr:hypothetical protein [Gemmatimonadaceae bacterium]
MSDKRSSIRIELTAEQRDQVKAAWGQDLAALELNVEQLEERVAPVTLNFTTIEKTYVPQKPDGTA